MTATQKFIRRYQDGEPTHRILEAWAAMSQEEKKLFNERNTQ